ncbi:MAG: uroporphyrinogen decarboxylase [Anaerolineaceae bacterium]|nr:uroporphyrinogen decarboxylase [Anaerolineaceae bacterium]
MDNTVNTTASLNTAHSLENSLFLRACRRQPTDATPIWLMRQAGRYMVEYRRLREKHTILEMIKTPELACEVTLQPINAFDLDAAIIFADILPPLEGMGLELDFIKGEGPTIYNPIRNEADVERLRVLPPEETLRFTLDAIKLARQELDLRGIPLIGFSGAPFTLASYAIEGGSSRNRIQVKNMMMSQPAMWHTLMTKLSEVAGHYLLAQAHAGAQVIQLFDSWAGELSAYDYENFVLPYSRHAIEIASQSGVPIIHFGTGTSGMLKLIQAAGGDVIGVDWRIDLAQAWQILGDNVSVQGNLDPVTLFADWDALEARSRHILDSVHGKPGHIFNLGHGILPETPVDNVRRLVDFVHEYSQKLRTTA